MFLRRSQRSLGIEPPKFGCLNRADSRRMRKEPASVPLAIQSTKRVSRVRFPAGAIDLESREIRRLYVIGQVDPACHLGSAVLEFVPCA